MEGGDSLASDSVPENFAVIPFIEQEEQEAPKGQKKPVANKYTGKVSETKISAVSGKLDASGEDAMQAGIDNVTVNPDSEDSPSSVSLLTTPSWASDLHHHIELQAAASEATFLRFQEEKTREVNLLEALHHSTHELLKTKLTIKQVRFEIACTQRNISSMHLVLFKCKMIIEQVQCEDDECLRLAQEMRREAAVTGSRLRQSAENKVSIIQSIRAQMNTEIEKGGVVVKNIESSLQGEIEEVRASHRILATKKEALEEQMAEIHHKNEKCKHTNENLLASNILLQKRIDEHRSSVNEDDDIQNQINALRSDIASLQAQHASLGKSKF